MHINKNTTTILKHKKVPGKNLDKKGTANIKLGMQKVASFLYVKIFT